MTLIRLLQMLALIAFSFTCIAACAAETRTPTQDGILYGTADGKPLTMD